MAYARTQIQNAASEGLDLVTFPETFLYIGQDHQQKHKVSQTLDGEIVQTFRGLAIQYDISILVGSIYEKTLDDDRLYNYVSVD